MKKVGTIKLNDLFEFMVPKDTLLVKYSSYFHPGIVFYNFINSLKEKYGGNIGIIIVDMLDNLGIIDYQLSAIGINLREALNSDNILVLKVGGSVDVGNVAERLKISASYMIHREKFKTKMELLLGRFRNKNFVVQITVGFDKFLMLLDDRERVFQIHDTVRYLTMKLYDIRDIIFINIDLWKHLTPYVAGYLEETALSMVEIVDPHHVKILKSVVVPDLQGKVVEF
ncbi:DUF257 family protein [Thermococcus sp.]